MKCTSKLRPQFYVTIKSLQFSKLSRQSRENAEKWMGRLRLAALECYYKEIDRQLKAKFIHGLSDTDMLPGIIMEPIKIEKNAEVTSEKVLWWAKRVEAHKAQSVIMSSLTDTKEFDKFKIMKATYKDSPRKPSAHIQVPAKQTHR